MAFCRQQRAFGQVESGALTDQAGQLVSGNGGHALDRSDGDFRQVGRLDDCAPGHIGSDLNDVVLGLQLLHDEHGGQARDDQQRDGAEDVGPPPAQLRIDLLDRTGGQLGSFTGDGWGREKVTHASPPGGCVMRGALVARPQCMQILMPLWSPTPNDLSGRCRLGAV